VGRLAGLRYADVVRRLRALGFEFDRGAKGSHELWRRATDGRKTTVPCHPGELPEGTVRAIVRQTGVSVSRFLAAGHH